MKRKRPDARDTEVFNMRMKKALLSRLRIAAESQRRTMANMANLLIEKGLEEKR